MKKIVMLALIFSLCSALLGCAKTEQQSTKRRPAAATHSHSSRETTEDLDAKFGPVIKDIDEYLEDLDFLKAINVALYNMNHYPEYPAFAEKHKEALQAYEAHVETQLQKYIEKGNYPGAIGKLNSFIEDDCERTFLIDRKDTLIKEYKDYAYNTALTLAYDEKYTEALDLVYESLKHFESKKVEDLIPILETYIPVAVGDMEVFLYGTEVEAEKNTDLEDNFGNAYNNSFYCFSFYDTNNSVTYLTNYKNYKYSKIYGTVGSRPNHGDEHSGYLYIIGITESGEKVDLWSKYANAGSKPQEFSIDISGYERITLRWSGDVGKVIIFDGYFVPVPQELPEMETITD